MFVAKRQLIIVGHIAVSQILIYILFQENSSQVSPPSLFTLISIRREAEKWRMGCKVLRTALLWSREGTEYRETSSGGWEVQDQDAGILQQGPYCCIITCQRRKRGAKKLLCE
ncbi:uncharacterized protein LOC144582346 isoform X1 [Callithrix jacchus]